MKQGANNLIIKFVRAYAWHPNAASPLGGCCLGVLGLGTVFALRGLGMVIAHVVSRSVSPATYPATNHTTH